MFSRPRSWFYTLQVCSVVTQLFFLTVTETNLEICWESGSMLWRRRTIFVKFWFLYKPRLDLLTWSCQDCMCTRSVCLKRLTTCTALSKSWNFEVSKSKSEECPLVLWNVTDYCKIHLLEPLDETQNSKNSKFATLGVHFSIYFSKVLEPTGRANVFCYFFATFEVNFWCVQHSLFRSPSKMIWKAEHPLMNATGQ